MEKQKTYHDNGKLQFDGEFLNGIESIGTRYNKKGELIFELTKTVVEGLIFEIDCNGK